MNTTPTLANRIADVDWRNIKTELDQFGAARIDRLLTSGECASIAKRYSNDDEFRSHIRMAHHGFGRGEYKYWSYPLPDVVQDLRTRLYQPMAEIANEWRHSLGYEKPFPKALDAYIDRCHRADQIRPTPLLLRYEANDYNCLHQDLYGEHIFPLQVAILLSEPNRDFAGGEFVLTEQRPRMQSRAEVVPLRKGDAVIFPVNARPVKGANGTYRVKMRHGVSRVRSGMRYTLGIIFHDAA